jgi:transposase
MTRRRRATQVRQGQAFKGRQFNAEVILWAVRWYLMFPISYRDLELMLQDRGVEVDHTTIFRWIQAYAAELEKRLRPHLRMSNGSWRVDETYVKVKGRWIYLYRAVDRSYGVGVDGPRRHRLCQNEVVVDLRQRGPSVEQINRIGMDTSKHVFQLHGVNAAETPVLRKKLRRREMVAFFEKLAPTVIAIEACGASHHWARLLQSFGHTVKLIPPQLVKPYVKRGKNDAADAEALCEAVSRPTMRFVPVKTAEQQAALMLVGVRDRLIRNRTQLANALRGYAAEFGLTAAKGMAHLAPLLERIQADESLPALARDLCAIQANEYVQLQVQIDEVDAKLTDWHRADECSRRLAKIPSVGQIGAVLLRMKTPDPEQFQSGRQFAAWIGLTPKDHSTAGKVRLGVITRAGDERLRSVLVVGATAVIQQARRSGRASPWLVELLKRKSPKLAAVALANKTARIAWKMMLTGETYTMKSASAVLVGAV